MGFDIEEFEPNYSDLLGDYNYKTDLDDEEDDYEDFERAQEE